ncbi:MAG: DMT family transporter [Flavobacteriales bacterium]|nr:DMT family transporter [Flavobacteriales bacterium]MCB9193345.1 DMT family transporter [Flavobacteriales bacterium]
MPRRSEHPSALPWVLMAVLSLIWGSSFILMKRGLFEDGRPVLAPLQLAAGRIVIAWAVLSPVLFRHAHYLRTHWRPLLGTGLLGNGIPAILFATAQSRIDSSLSGMLNSLTPLMTLLAGILFFHAPLRGGHFIGIALGLLGAIGLILLKDTDDHATWSLFAMMPILGTICYGLSGNIVKRFLYDVPPVAISALALTFLAPAFIALGFATDIPATLATDPAGWKAMGFVALLAILSSALALVLWNMLLHRVSAVWASSVTYLMPVVAIGWGILDGEHVGPGRWAMVLVILSGVYVVHLAERR